MAHHYDYSLIYLVGIGIIEFKKFDLCWYVTYVSKLPTCIMTFLMLLIQDVGVNYFLKQKKAKVAATCT
jgi:hypothetical protein